MVNTVIKEKLLIDFSCAMYLIFLAPMVLRIVNQAGASWGASNGAVILAIVLFVFNIIEVFAVSPFISDTLYAIEDKGLRVGKQTTLILLVVLHAVVTLMSVMYAFQLFGYTYKTHAAILSFVILFCLVKEVLLFANSSSPTPKILFSPFYCKWLTALYSCLIFTIFLESQKMKPPPNMGMLLLYLVPMGIIFAVYYYSLRLPYSFYSVVHKTSANEKLVEFASFLIAFLPFAYRRLF